MRLLNAVVALLFIALGVLFGALNRQPVRIEFGFRAIENASLGFTLLLAMLAGALLAGLVLTVGVIWPLRLRLRRAAPADAATTPVAHD